MTTKPAGLNVAARAIAAVNEGITYGKMKCDAFIEYCVNQCGGALDTTGINDMVRHHCAWLGTLENARAAGRLVKGAILLIWRDESEKLPGQYRGDGMGDFYHGAIYVGEKALYDTDNNGVKRLCNAVHSSETMGRVAGTTTENAYTHVMWLDVIDYGVAVSPGVELGAEAAEAVEDVTGDTVTGDTAPAIPDDTVDYVVVSPDGNPVKLRPQPTVPRQGEKSLYWTVANNTYVSVERKKDDWSLITARCTDGATRRAYMMSKFIKTVRG